MWHLNTCQRCMHIIIILFITKLHSKDVFVMMSILSDSVQQIFHFTLILIPTFRLGIHWMDPPVDIFQMLWQDIFGAWDDIKSV
eukprot:00460.XXX_484_735_1 [CDS] Oithona nana genome sequencing.